LESERPPGNRQESKDTRSSERRATSHRDYVEKVASADSIGQQQHRQRVVMRAIVIEQRIVVLVDQELPRSRPNQPRVAQRGRQRLAIGAPEPTSAPLVE